MNAIQTSDDTECTAFSVACKNGHKDVVQLLLDSEGKNIELNARDNEGYTQFMIACEFGQKDVVQLLLDHLEDIYIDFKFKKQNRRHCIYDFLRPWT